MNDTATIEYRQDCDQLLEVATPYIYRRNLFRILNIPVDATPKNVQRQESRRKMQEKLGIASVAPHNGPLALNPSPSEEDVRAAMERLNSPIDRLLDEIFWFWPTNGDAAKDDALKALETGDIKKATEIWAGLAKTSSEGHIATHNLAVLDHLVALDYEAKLTTTGLSEDEQQKLEGLWRRGFGRWKDVITGEDFWSVVKDRVRDLNDTQLTTGFVRRARNTLPIALLLISAKIAYQAAERSDLANAGRHVKLLREVGFGDGLVDQAVREAIKPIRNRIKTAVDTARDRWTQKPQQGHHTVRELHNHSQEMLATIDAILPPDDPTRAGMHDTVAEAILEGQVAFGNKTNDWRECLKLVDLALEVAQGDAVRAHLTENRQILQKNAEAGNGWCAAGYWDLPDEMIEALESARELCNAGGFGKAIEALVALDPKIGKPLLQALAYCLSLRGIREANEAVSEYNNATDIIKSMLGPDPSTSRLTTALMNSMLMKPTPHTPSYDLPACPFCGSKYYTSWANFKYKGVDLWMCSSCSSKHDRQSNRHKETLKKKTANALKHLTLAHEINPDDPGIKRNLDSLKGAAGEIGVSAVAPSSAPQSPGDIASGIGCMALITIGLAHVVVFGTGFWRGVAIIGIFIFGGAAISGIGDYITATKSKRKKADRNQDTQLSDIGFDWEMIRRQAIDLLENQ